MRNQTSFSARSSLKIVSGIIVTMSAVAMLSACASATHLTRSKSHFDQDYVATYVDAKQRVVLSAKIPGDVITEIVDEKEITRSLPDRVITCAEPSPDALSALAASQKFSLLGSKGIEAALTASLAESAGSIGLRTQSIQLMRDSMYRLCEAYMADAISQGSFETMHRRFQSSMVTILAIEQLTGTVRPAAVVLSGDTEGGSAEAVSEATEKTLAKKAEYQAAEQVQKDHKEGELKTAEDALKAKKLLAGIAPGADLTDAQKTSLKAELDAVEAEQAKAKNHKEKTTALKENYDALNQSRMAAIAGGSSASSKGALKTYSTPSTDAAGVKYIAETVEKIVKQTLELQFSRELCTTYFMQNQFEKLDDPADEDDTPKSLNEFCLRLVSETEESLATTRKHQEAVIEQITNMDSEQYLEYLELQKEIAGERFKSNQHLLGGSQLMSREGIGKIELLDLSDLLSKYGADGE